MFELGKPYSKADIYSVLKVPEDKQRGSWDTGYTPYENNWFFFCNIGVPGRTGHDYQNYFDGDLLISHAKLKSKIDHPSIKSIQSVETKKFIFYREDDLSDWIFAGMGTLVELQPGPPLRFVWQFNEPDEPRNERLAEEILPTEKFYEGSKRQVSVNIYERNPIAREKCIERYGLKCTVCSFDFEKMWGALGKGYIHVHHLNELSEIGKEYLLDPVTDLRPVCPNCHSMLHRRRPAYSIDELRALLTRQEKVEMK
jgi:5-methylcytosine-specific restriction protein A